MFKIFFHTSAGFFIITFTELLWGHNLQIDSLALRTELPLDSTHQILLLNHDNEFNPKVYNFFTGDFSDPLRLSLNNNILDEQQKAEDIYQSSISDQWKINDRLTNYFLFQRKTKLKSELGIFGKILSNSKNITAVILAILHIIKYKKRLY